MFSLTGYNVQPIGKLFLLPAAAIVVKTRARSDPRAKPPWTATVIKWQRLEIPIRIDAIRSYFRLRNGTFTKSSGEECRLKTQALPEALCARKSIPAAQLLFELGWSIIRSQSLT